MRRIIFLLLLICMLPFTIADTNVLQITELGIDDGADSDNNLDTAASAGAANADLYWGQDLLCDVSRTNCGWGDIPTGSGTNNYVAYWTGAGTIDDDNFPFYWDASANELGLGTTGPDTELHIVGSLCVDTDDTCVDPGDGTLIAHNMTTAANAILPHINLDSASSGGTFTSQGAYIALGESASGDGGAAFYLTYVGNGWSYVGSGGGVSSDGIPDQNWWAFDYNADVIYTNADLGIGDTVPDADLHVVGGVCIEDATSCTDPGNGALYIEDVWEINGDGSTPALNISSNDAIITMGIGTAGPHGVVFGDNGAGEGMHMVYRTGAQHLTFEQGPDVDDVSNILTIDIDTSHVGIGVGASSEDTELHVVGGMCIDTDSSCTDPGTGDLTFTGGYAEGDNDEYMQIGITDDIISFYGSGGDDTDLSIDLDGTAPALYSITDSAVGFAEPLDVTGNVVVQTDIYFADELLPDGSTCSDNQGLRRTGSNNWDCVNIPEAAGSADHVAYWSDGDTLTYDSGAFRWDDSSGLLGVGSTAPTTRLHITTTTSNHLQLSDSASDEFQMGKSASAYTIRHDGTSFITFEDGGDVGISNGGPDADLHIVGGVCIDSDSTCTDPGDGSLTLVGDITMESATSDVFLGDGQTGTHRVIFGDDAGASEPIHLEYEAGNDRLIVENGTSGQNYFIISRLASGAVIEVGAFVDGTTYGIEINGDSADPDTGIYIDDAVSYGLYVDGSAQTGVWSSGSATYAIYARNTDTSANTDMGIRGYNSRGTTGYGGYFQSTAATTNRAVYGSVTSSQCSYYTPDSSGGYCSGSSYKWKRNIETLSDAVEKIEKIRGVTFNIDNFKDTEFGFIAEEIYKVYPSAVSVDANGDPEALDANFITPILIEATKDQQNDIDAWATHFDSDVLYYAGDHIVSGVHGVVQPHASDPAQQVAYYGVFGPQQHTYVRGTATLVNGQVTIDLPAHFAEMSAYGSVTVDLTPRSAQSRGLAVTYAGVDRIEVVELQSGTGNYEFDYIAYGVRRESEVQEDNRYVVPRDGFDVEYATRYQGTPIQGMLISSGKLNADNTVNANTFNSLGWHVPQVEPHPWDDTPQNPADVSTFTDEGIHPADYYNTLINPPEPQEEGEEFDDTIINVDDHAQFDKARYQQFVGKTAGIDKKWEQTENTIQNRRKEFRKDPTQKKERKKMRTPPAVNPGRGQQGRGQGRQGQSASSDEVIVLEIT